MDEKNDQKRKSRMEKAEGDRDTPESAHGRGDEDAGGITNRPLDEEIESQEAVPDRGHRKDDDQNR